MVGFGERLKNIRKNMDKTQVEFAEILGLKGQSSYGNYEREIAELPFELLQTLNNLGVNLNWLINNKGNPFTEEQQRKQGLKDDYFEIPVMAEVGAGEIFDGELPMAKGIKIILPWRPFKGEIAFKVNGDSMETTLYNGDYITAVRINPDTIKPGFDYLVVSEFGSQIKKVVFENDKIVLISRNPKYLGQRIIPENIAAVWEIISRISPYRVPEESDPEKVIKIVECRNN